MNRQPNPAAPSDDAKARRERASLLGHDIRNAVSDILGGLALADLSPLDGNSSQQLLRVRSASELLARLAAEVMALVSDEADPDQTQRTGFRLQEFLTKVEARWAAHAREHGLVFELARGSDLPALVGTDQGALDRILANLIGNAIKYSGRGNVKLCVDLRARETLCFCVKDDGPGFSDGALAVLFERNGRTADNDQPGDGLGLHIVHDLTDQINAQMTVANRESGGASVCVHLPRAAWAPGAASVPGTGEQPSLAGQKVLVAEDNQTNQLLVQQMLETLGARCYLASDGIEALELMMEQSFDLALVDIEMPRLSGLDLIRAFRTSSYDKVARMPVLAITAYVLSANRAEIYEAGADGILAKPILSLEAFGAAIADVILKRQGPRPPLKSSESMGNETPYNLLHLDRLLALAGADGGPELLHRLRQDFSSVGEGLAAGIRTSDFALLRARTHVLISLAGAVGAQCLQDRAQEMNAAANAGDKDFISAIGPRVLERLELIDRHLGQEFLHRFGEDAR